MVSLKNNKGIIFAADIVEKQKLLNIIIEISQFIEAIKIGNLVLYQHSWKIIEEIKSMVDLPIIADLKLMDIPEIAERAAKSAFEVGVDGLMVCGAIGEEAIISCKLQIKNKPLFIFTEFTHPSGLITRKMADEYINLSLDLGCDGIQVPGTKPSRIKQIRKKVGNQLIILSCGIGAQGPQYGSAIANGADYEIIGRSIYNAEQFGSSPLENARRAKNVILSLLDTVGTV